MPGALTYGNRYRKPLRATTPLEISPTTAFAGRWEGFSWPDGTVARTFTIITTSANATMGELHHMVPAIPEPVDWPAWLATC